MRGWRITDSLAFHMEKRNCFSVPRSISCETCLAEARALRYNGNSSPSGPVAQLGARLNGIQEVTSSILVRSTNYVNYAASLLRGRPPFAPFTFAAAALTFDLRCPPR